VALEDFLEALGVDFRFFEVFGKTCGQFFVVSSFSHLGQRFDQLIFRAVEVLQFVNVEVV